MYFRLYVSCCTNILGCTQQINNWLISNRDRTFGLMVNMSADPFQLFIAFECPVWNSAKKQKQKKKVKLCADATRGSERDCRTEVGLAAVAVWGLARRGLNYLPGWDVNANMLPNSQETAQPAKERFNDLTHRHTPLDFVFVCTGCHLLFKSAFSEWTKGLFFHRF